MARRGVKGAVGKISAVANSKDGNTVRSRNAWC